VFSSGVANLSPIAYQYQGYKFNRAFNLPTVARVTQAIVGELSVADAISKAGADMADAVKQAQK
jgi:alpha-1,4-digalacturonate transport system substrate-binding protein